MAQRVEEDPHRNLTDCKSLHDYVRKQAGGVPENKRLLLDLEIVRDQVRDENAQLKWIGTKYQLADALTKDGTEASLDLRHVLDTNEVSIMEDKSLDAILSKKRAEVKTNRKQAYEDRRERKIQRAEEMAGPMKPRRKKNETQRGPAAKEEISEDADERVEEELPQEEDRKIEIEQKAEEKATKLNMETLDYIQDLEETVQQGEAQQPKEEISAGADEDDEEIALQQRSKKVRRTSPFDEVTAPEPEDKKPDKEPD